MSWNRKETLPEALALLDTNLKLARKLASEGRDSARATHDCLEVCSHALDLIAKKLDARPN